MHAFSHIFIAAAVTTANVQLLFQITFLFYCVFTPLSTIGGNYLSESAHWNDYAVLFVTMGCNLVSEYLYDRFVVYRNSMNTNARGQRALEKKAAEEKSREK